VHVLIATDGALDADAASTFASALAGDGGSVTVATVVRIPRRLVADLKAQYGDQPPVSVDTDVEYVGAPKSGAQLERGWPGEDAIIDRYLSDKGDEICVPLAAKFEGSNVSVSTTAVEGDDVADGVMSLCTETGADVIVIGARGINAFQGLLGSTGARIVRRSTVPVLVLR